MYAPPLMGCPRRSRWSAALATGALVLAIAPVAEPQTKKKPETPEQKAEKQACVDAHTTGQGLARDGKLTAARAEFITCGRETCPGAIRNDCVQWLTDANASQPSVVVEARDERGKQTTQVQVYIDGRLVAEGLDGRAIEVDPGTRAFRYVSRKGSAIDERVVILEGQKNRKLMAAFPRDKDAPRPFRVPTLSYVLGGIGVGGLANFIAWAAIGQAKENELHDTCAPRCTQDDADSMRSRYLFADVSLGLALAAFGGAVVVALTQQDGPEPAPGGDTVSVQAVFGPGSAALRGSF